MRQPPLRPQLATSRTLRTSLELSEEEPEEEYAVIQNPEKKKKRILQAFRRMILRIWFMATTVLREKVETYLTTASLRTEEPQTEAHTPHVAAPKKNRRSDLTGVGKSLPPTNKVYPVPRDRCDHKCSQVAGQPEPKITTLVAAGGRQKDPVTGNLEPMYT